ncbi:MAG TPA: PASTA domain-containing protein, partial [Thermoanaerobaculia bacterium]|nr:PASTA domain-containing protein [Thermoanaerobaculia bacterium]
PRLVILAVIDEPRGQHYGGIVAAPVFREVAEGTLRYLGVAPSIPSRTIGVAPPLLAAFSQPRTPAGPATAVPDLRGLDARAAIAKAVASGLTVRAIGSGVVISQNPEAGEALPKGRQLTIKLGVIGQIGQIGRIGQIGSPISPIRPIRPIGSEARS